MYSILFENFQKSPMFWYKVKETGQGTNNEEHKTFHKDQAVKSYHTEKKESF